MISRCTRLMIIDAIETASAPRMRSLRANLGSISAKSLRSRKDGVEVIGNTLSLEGIEKHFDGSPAVREISFKVEAGEFLSVLGPSGSGKTTVLSMIAGFERPTRGSISIGGRDVTLVPPNRRNIGMVFQKYALFPHLTVSQNIAFPLKMRGKLSRREIADRVARILDTVHLGNYAGRYPHELSGGQQQRVALARALVFEPPVILMDEPLGALDKKLREAMQFEIKRLHERLGATVVYVTHDQDEALTMSDRVAVMFDGNIEQVGTPLDLYRKPASERVADFIGRMNFLDGHRGRDHTGQPCIRISDAPALPEGGVSTRAGHDGPADDQVRLAIRPERVTLARRGEGGGLALPGIVETSVFIGSCHIFLVRLPGHGDKTIQVQATVSGSVPFQRNENVDVLVDESAMHVFPAQGRQAA